MHNWHEVKTVLVRLLTNLENILYILIIGYAVILKSYNLSQF